MPIIAIDNINKATHRFYCKLRQIMVHGGAPGTPQGTPEAPRVPRRQQEQPLQLRPVKKVTHKMLQKAKHKMWSKNLQLFCFSFFSWQIESQWPHWQVPSWD